jgi:hypothetical protein
MCMYCMYMYVLVCIVCMCVYLTTGDHAASHIVKVHQGQATLPF